MKSSVLTSIVAHAAAVSAVVVWDGRFTNNTATVLTQWSFSNEVGKYQYYIHGNSSQSAYVNFDASFKNPADSRSALGAKITLDSTSYWHGQTMRRTELIPQTANTSAITSGTVYYHFSLMRSDTNAPSVNREHQIAFFESHFTEMKAGWISGEAATSDANLRWDVSSSSQWSTNWTAGVWHNVAYEIDFAGNTVGFWHSTGSDDLAQVVPPVSASVSSNGADWHLGVLELPRTGYADTTEDIFFSGVYIENGELTKSVSGPSSSSESCNSNVNASTSAAPSSGRFANSTVSASSGTLTATGLFSVATDDGESCEANEPTTTASSSPTETATGDGDSCDAEGLGEDEASKAFSTVFATSTVTVVNNGMTSIMTVVVTSTVAAASTSATTTATGAANIAAAQSTYGGNVCTAISTVTVYVTATPSTVFVTVTSAGSSGNNEKNLTPTSVPAALGAASTTPSTTATTTASSATNSSSSDGDESCPADEAEPTTTTGTSAPAQTSSSSSTGNAATDSGDDDACPTATA